MRFVVRPMIKTEYTTLFQESALIQNRDTVMASGLATSMPSGETQPWRHGWLYDAGSDQAPVTPESSNRSPWSTSPMPDVPCAKIFFGAAVAVGKPNDILIAPNCRSKGGSLEYGKLMSLTVKDDLNVHYAEGVRRGWRNCHEVVHACCSKALTLPGRPRRTYTMSTTQSNCLVQVDDEAEHKPEWMVTREQKLAILGPDSLTATQKNVEMGDQVVLFHWEKPVKLWEEIFHHYGLTSMVVASVGRLPLLQAAVNLGIRTLALCRNTDHMQVAKESMINWMVIESSINQEAPYFVSRAMLIDQYGLEPDKPPPEPSGSQPAAENPSAGDDEGKEDGEEEDGEEEDVEGRAQSSRKRRRVEGDVDDGNGEEEDEVEEDDAEESDSEELEDATTPKTKAKRAGKAKAKSKSKAKAKAKHKSKATAED